MKDGLQDRRLWVETLIRIIDPVLQSGAVRKLRETMPKYDEEKWNAAKKDRYGLLEAVGRTLCGASGWLSHAAADEWEEEQRSRYALLARRTIDAITDPASPDRATFFASDLPDHYQQCLVDTAFLCHAILRAKEELFDRLDGRVKENLIRCLKESRKVRPVRNNWLLFSGMVEAALALIGEEPDLMRVDYCLSQHEQWYKGDGLYGDGPDFHFDYYNSYVIQPMFIDIARVFADRFPEANDLGRRRLETAVKRGTRYAAILERMIAPDGTFPVVGRSIAYRTGAFQMLAQAATQNMIPDGVTKPQIRCALTEVIRRCFTPENFNEDGWLKIGVCADQPDLGEYYICSGSLYLCTTGFLPLSLGEDDAFWNSDYEDYTSRKIWSGKNEKADRAI